MVILNLGCGSRTSAHCINVDWSPYLRLKRNPFGSKLAPLLLRGERGERFRALDETILVHDLRRPLPMGDASVDAVYHSHVLEHLDRNLTAPFLAEVWRVLRRGGIQRIVVPDLEACCRRYLDHFDLCLTNPDMAIEHDRYIGDIIEQMVRREAVGSSKQPPARRFLENLLLGDARRRGETHQWMYDRVNLSVLLSDVGFREITFLDYKTSAIPGWHEIRLDELEDGGEHIAGSLYVEAVK